MRHLLVFLLLAQAAPSQTPLKGEALTGLKKAAIFFATAVGSQSGYLWQYSADLKQQEGEGVFTRDTVEVQPPGTPSVGAVYLDAWEATGDRFYLDLARATGTCLLRGQLRSGGWAHQIEFGERRGKHAYRTEKTSRKKRDVSSFDDDQTQSALRFLMRLDQALDFKDAAIREATQYALDAILAAQFPNGGWPQVFRGPAPDGLYPSAQRASFPEEWPRSSQYKPYWEYVTFNDNNLAKLIELFFLAEKIYGKARYREAAEKAGGFILLSQLPQPQPAWAQQYNFKMHPDWARKFEPPSVTGGESQGILRVLMKLYRETGNKQYLEPIPRAIRYLRKSELPDGKLARFYELETNRPLYFNRQYELTHDDGDLPTHYGFKVGSKLDSIEREFRELVSAPWSKPTSPKIKRPSEQEVRRVIADLDERGAWVEGGMLKYHKGEQSGRIISCRTFIRNAGVLTRYLAD